ncbi:hypothetical protein IZ6_14210 [Terrihabitans soli]|uniref:DUF1402 family protein n=1 Tax=Terrihabitans soli TaxID=708113 RepID=A0A6S6QMT4_9HYPH|nr:hypothetical protein IZ6_14210 [Terrihabitans soli]
MKRVLLAMLLAAVSAVPVSAAGLTVVPPGNRNATQPPIPRDSTARTEETKTTFEAKYKKVIDLLTSDKTLIAKIKSTAAAYDIDPVHMIGAIVGEHTYNVDAYDRLQTYYVQALSYAGNRFRFDYNGETIAQFIARPQFEKCAKFADDSYALWTCREDIWDSTFKGKTVEGTAFPKDRFNKVFFQPFYAGQTFGLGQQTPLMALTYSDTVAKISGYPKLSENRAAEVYDAIMNPDKSLAYMAASIHSSIEDYKTIARLDISKNPGITATLYNIGGSEERARTLRARGGLPEENYFGWFVNSKIKELRALVSQTDAAAAPVAQSNQPAKTRN